MKCDANAAKPRILLADDEAILRDSLTSVLSDEGMAVTAVANGSEALRLLNRRDYDLLISDVKMPGTDGIALLKAATSAHPNLAVILITAYATIESAVEAMKLGAADYVAKPLLFEDLMFKVHRLLELRDLRHENRRLQAKVGQDNGRYQIVGKADGLQNVVGLVEKIAQTRSNVLIVGDSGTGKELIARAIHAAGITSKGSFVPVNCGGIPEGLFESEMFGHCRGAFTGAVRDRIGFFEAANGGTLFLDEMSNLSPGAQASLLRAIEEKSATRVGDCHPIRFDLRIVSATNVDLGQLVGEGKFREDLLFRLNVVKLQLPGLGERPGDIPLLVDHFIRKYNKEMNRACSGIREEALAILKGRAWRGNIRELENVIERALIFAEDREITPDDLPFGAAATSHDSAGPERGPSATADQLQNPPEGLAKATRTFEREQIRQVLENCGYDKNQASKLLEISLQKLYRKIRELGLPLQAEVV